MNVAGWVWNGREMEMEAKTDFLPFQLHDSSNMLSFVYVLLEFMWLHETRKFMYVHCGIFAASAAEQCHILVVLKWMEKKLYFENKENNPYADWCS